MKRQFDRHPYIDSRPTWVSLDNLELSIPGPRNTLRSAHKPTCSTRRGVAQDVYDVSIQDTDRQYVQGYLSIPQSDRFQALDLPGNPGPPTERSIG